jgi:hypothetical protein
MLVLQIIADLIFCLIIVVLLARLKKSVDKDKKNIDREAISELQGLISRTQKDSEVFLARLDENFRKFSREALNIEAKEKRLASLLEEIDDKTGPLSNSKRNNVGFSGDKDYESVAEFLRSGLSLEEIARQTNVPSEEIALIGNLEKLKKTE